MAWGDRPQATMQANKVDGELARFMNAIGTIESGNKYDAVGVQTGKLGRAQGRYQIMSGNWAAWAREAGLPGNADWKNPAHQDRVARFKMGEYYKRYKDWDLVAVAWFAGPGTANRVQREGLASMSGRKDALGTSVPKYVQKMRGVFDGDKKDYGSPDALERRATAPPQRQTSIGAVKDAFGQMKDAATPGRTRPDWVTPETAEVDSEPEFGDDQFGQIMAAISQAATRRGGQILDAGTMFGMPTRRPAVLAADTAQADADAVDPEAHAGEGDGGEFDPSEFKGLEGLEGRFGNAVASLLREAGGRVSVVSGRRSRQQQEALYAKYKAGTGNLAAKPGSSRHEHGAAVDFGGDLALVAKLAPKYGLKATVKGEPWHWELA